MNPGALQGGGEEAQLEERNRPADGKSRPNKVYPVRCRRRVAFCISSPRNQEIRGLRRYPPRPLVLPSNARLTFGWAAGQGPAGRPACGDVFGGEEEGA